MSFEDLMKSLKAEYIASLPEKIITIRQQVATNSAAQLKDSFHKLKGTGSTYGLHEVTELAAVVEAICHVAPQHAQVAASEAALILQDIYVAHQQGQAFPVERDARFQMIQKLLPN